MSKKEDQADVGDLTENTEYEDDFEKDLIDEEEKQNLGEKKNPEKKDVKASDSLKEDNEKMEESLDQLSDAYVKVIYANEKYLGSKADTERDYCECDGARERCIQKSKLKYKQEPGDGEDEETKRYVLEKIDKANKQLGNQAPGHQNRERKLKFKDEVDRQAPPPGPAEVGKTAIAKRGDVSLGLSQLHISDDMGQKSTSLPKRAGSEEETTNDIETHLPTASQTKETPPSDSKPHPDSALNGAKDLGKQKTESANVKSSTYSLTPRQKELRKQIELRNEKLRREEEEMKRELEEMRRRQNEFVFRAWLQKKKEQLQKEKRIRHAKKLEELRMKEVNRDPEEAYQLWLKKKQQQYAKEKRIEFLKRQTEEVSYFPTAEECDRAFRDWLRRKREEKQAAELAAKERARQLRLEARRARRMRNIHCI